MKVKMILIFLLMTALSYKNAKAQTGELKIGNYLIKNTVNKDKTFGFEVYKQSDMKLLIQQKEKPYSSGKTGFLERQNAVVAAMWYVKELQDGRNDIKKLTLTKAGELGITQSDLN